MCVSLRVVLFLLLLFCSRMYAVWGGGGVLRSGVLQRQEGVDGGGGCHFVESGPEDRDRRKT